MKKIKQIAWKALLATLILSGCDVPQNPEAVNYNSTRGPASDPFMVPTQPSNPVTPTNTPTTSNSGSIEVPDDVSHCLWSDGSNQNFMYSSQHLSENDSRSVSFSVCQSRATDSVIHFQVESPIRDAQVCFIPMNQQGPSSTYIGEPRCLNADDNKKIYRIQMFKTRQGFENMAINSVMIIKDKMYPFAHPYNRSLLAPDAFLLCNQQLTNPNYPDPSFCNTFIGQRRYHFQRF